MKDTINSFQSKVRWIWGTRKPKIKEVNKNQQGSGT